MKATLLSVLSVSEILLTPIIQFAWCMVSNTSNTWSWQGGQGVKYLACHGEKNNARTFSNK